MKELQLIEILKTFDKEELKSLKKFIISPFLKSPRNTENLFDYLITFHPDFDSPNLSKENVFKKLFPGGEFSDKKLNNFIFDLSKTIEDFIAYDTFKSDEVEYLLSLSKGFLNRKLTKNSMRVNKLIEKKLSPGFSPHKDFVSKFKRLTNYKSTYFIEDSDFENLLEGSKNYFEVASLQFIIDYSEIKQAKNSAATTYGKKLSNVFIESLFESFDIEKLIKLLEKSDYAYTPLVEVYFYKFKTIEEPEVTDYYYKLKENFIKILPMLDREERCNLFNYIATYCSLKVIKKNPDFIKEGLENYKSMVENNAYSVSENEDMQILTYRNIFLYCVNIGEIIWLKEFIEKYTDKLNPEYRDDMRNLAYANLYFVKKEFEKALVYISKINQEFFLLKTDVKTLLLFIYYELSYFEQAYSLIDTFKHFLTNTKEISDTHKEFFNNFVKYYFGILKIKSGQSKDDASFYFKKLEKEKNIVCKNWLLEKVSELSKNKTLNKFEN